MNLFDVYPLFDVNIVKGKGCHVWDDKGQEYLDLYGGHAVISVGHCHPHYIEKLTRQLGRLGFYSNSVVNKLQVELAERLGKACGYEDYQFFLINSGAEANENALKLASFYNGRKRVLSLSKAFHGRTSLAVETTDNPKIIAPINANGHVTYLPLNDLDAFKAELAKGDVCAVIVECIQGVGGIRLATAEFMQGVRQACDETDTVLICDEIQCGYGRSGKFFAHQHLENAAKVGNFLMEGIKALRLPHVVDVRGRGLMIGVELDVPYKEIRNKLLFEEHCFTGCSGTNVLRLLPPLCLGEAEAADFLKRLERVVNN